MGLVSDTASCTENVAPSSASVAAAAGTDASWQVDDVANGKTMVETERAADMNMNADIGTYISPSFYITIVCIV